MKAGATLWFCLFVGLARGAEAPPPRRLILCDDVRDPLALDPHKQFSEKNHTLLQQIYEGLVRFDAAGRVEPALAVSWERIDPLRMRFKLREGVRFHNGEPLTAEAVRFTMERLLDPKTGFPGFPFVATISRVEVVDPMTVDVVTHQPDGILLNRLCILLILPPVHFREAGEAGLTSRPVGTGPFRFHSLEPGRAVVLRANRDYWMPGVPKLDEVVFRFIPEEEKLKELFAGRVDLVTNIPGTKTLEVQKRRDTAIIKGRTFFTAFAAMNPSEGPFSDVRVRRAMNLAVDRESLVRYDAMGNAVSLATLSMPGEPGHNPDLKPYPYDPRRARALLREAGYPKGFEVSAIVNANAVRTAKILSAQLARVGVRVRPTVSSDAQLLERFADPRFKMGVGGLPDPMGHSYFIQSIALYSPSPYSQGRLPEYDRRLEEMARTIEDGKREELGREIDRYVYEQALAIFGYQRIQTHAVRRGVRFTHYVTGMPHLYSAENEATHASAE